MDYLIALWAIGWVFSALDFRSSMQMIYDAKKIGIKEAQDFYHQEKPIHYVMLFFLWPVYWLILIQVRLLK